MPHRRKAFTLVELLVVISIIGVLLSILLPALGEARRKAQQVKDVAQLKQHGTAISNYSAANKGRMPNNPRGNGVTEAGQGTGLRSLPATRYAWNNTGQDGVDGGDLSHNGFGFGGDGIRGDFTWKTYHIAFGDYIVDGSGFELLNEVFVAPGNSNTLGNWDAIREKSSPDCSDWPDDFNVSAEMMPSPPTQWAYLGGLDFDVQQTCAWALTGTYRYTLAGLMGSNKSDTGPDVFWHGETGLGGSTDPWAEPNWTSWQSWVQVSDFRYPSKKVAFWDFFASESPQGLYYLPRAETAVAMVDGSASYIEPFEIMPSRQEATQAFNRGDGWGTNSKEFSPQLPHTTQIGGGDQFPTLDPLDKPFAWFIWTDRGPEGRDLQ